MPENGEKKEAVTVGLPPGMKQKAKDLGVNISFHAAKAVKKEIDRIEQYKKTEGTK
jgi:post-segregation antitoxin (ccd killing protein)